MPQTIHAYRYQGPASECGPGQQASGPRECCRVRGTHGAVGSAASTVSISVKLSSKGGCKKTSGGHCRTWSTSLTTQTEIPHPHLGPTREMGLSISVGIPMLSWKSSRAPSILTVHHAAMHTSLRSWEGGVQYPLRRVRERPCATDDLPHVMAWSAGCRLNVVAVRSMVRGRWNSVPRTSYSVAGDARG